MHFREAAKLQPKLFPVLEMRCVFRGREVPAPHPRSRLLNPRSYRYDSSPRPFGQVDKPSAGPGCSRAAVDHLRLFNGLLYRRAHGRRYEGLTMADVLLRNVVKRFDEVEAVRSIDLDIRSSELVVLVGPSGCGKSTTLRMIAGLEEITSG